MSLDYLRNSEKGNVVGVCWVGIRVVYDKIGNIGGDLDMYYL